MKRIHPAHLLVHMQFKIFVRNASGPKSVWHRQTTFSAGLFCLYSVSCRNIPTSAGLVVSQSAHASSWLRCFLPFSANKFTDRSERNIDQSRSHSAYQYSSITNDCPWYLSASWVRRSNRWHFSPPLVPALRAKKAHPSLEWRSQDDEILKDIENISDDFDLSNLTPRPATGKFLLILSLVCLICGRHCTVKGFSLCVPLLYVDLYMKGVCSLLSVSSDPFRPSQWQQDKFHNTKDFLTSSFLFWVFRHPEAEKGQSR